MKHIEGNFGNLVIMTAGVIVGLAVLDGVSAWVEIKYPNPLTSGYLKLRNIRFAVMSKNGGGSSLKKVA